MTLLIISFIAGVLTVLAPCTLALLPIIIGGSIENAEQKLKPVIITASLSISIIVFTLLLKVSTVFIDIPQQTWATISGLIIIIIGLVYIYPTAWEKLSSKFNLSGKSSELLAKSSQKKSVWGDILIGASLGPVFASCSPTYFLILAAVLPESFVIGLLYLFAYSLGLGLVLLLVGYLGQRFVSKIKWAADPKGWFKRILGALFIVVGIFIFTGADKKLQTYLLDNGLYDVSKIEIRLLEKADIQ
jgi:cytochrome c-type biogenesis protein